MARVVAGPATPGRSIAGPRRADRDLGSQTGGPRLSVRVDGRVTGRRPQPAPVRELLNHLRRRRLPLLLDALRTKAPSRSDRPRPSPLRQGHRPFWSSVSGARRLQDHATLWHGRPAPPLFRRCRDCFLYFLTRILPTKRTLDPLPLLALFGDRRGVGPPAVPRPGRRRFSAGVDGRFLTGLPLRRIDGVSCVSLQTVRRLFGSRVRWRGVSRRRLPSGKGARCIFELDQVSARCSARGSRSESRAGLGQRPSPVSFLTTRFPASCRRPRGVVSREKTTVDPMPSLSSPRLTSPYPSQKPGLVELGPGCDIVCWPAVEHAGGCRSTTTAKRGKDLVDDGCASRKSRHRGGSGVSP